MIDTILTVLGMGVLLLLLLGSAVALVFLAGYLFEDFKHKEKE
tara:strand:+ start:113 stop:241 length:129 start_codon:yes stop_codon:yes gene_type:complete